MSGAASTNALQFTNRENDGSGLYFNRARFYSGSLQRWLSEDPVEFADGPNLYAYAHNAPVSFSDPFGLQARPSWSEFWHDVWNAGASATYQAKQLADQSLADAARSGLFGPHNGLQDAYRHCLWSCRMTQAFGAAKAQVIGDEQENQDVGQPPWERAMDLANNAAGRACAPKSDRVGKRRDCADTCMELLRNGQLYGPYGIPLPVWARMGSFR